MFYFSFFLLCSASATCFGDIRLTPIGLYKTGLFARESAEISTYDKGSKRRARCSAHRETRTAQRALRNAHRATRIAQC
ncbi:MAG: hypothetical protein AAF492_02665, partial [Verrucomicrobiota bacterium]